MADNDPRKIEILLLGHHQQHHNSEAYTPILASALAREGINISYSEDPDVLADAEEMAKYDGLILYANHDEISPEQEKGLLQYVKNGKGFIPLHCASFCFRNSDEFVKLVGAQFKEHGTGVFSTTIVNKAHPITAQLDTFSTWDETYVHHLHNDDRTVLMVREENGQSEPWTWVRNYGKGRVFYTAYGHDERTWENPGFQQLVKEGILWAVGDRVHGLWTAYHEQLPEQHYRDIGPIPNYEKRDPAPRFQDPLSPEASKALSQVPPGFSLELFAAEPDIINPIAINWDEKGRLWVIETVDYPNTVREVRTVGDDRIKICEDTDGDGRADKFTIFADQLNIPTSMAFVNGGVLISQAPYFIFLKDENGDDKADVREIVMDGWGTFDTHAGPSNLQYGMDNQIWGVVGYSGFKGSIGGEEERTFRQGIYRLSRDFQQLEMLTRTSNNTWGLGFTEENDVFASTANNTHSVFMSIPDASFTDVKGIPLSGSRKIDGHYAMHPITRNFRQVDVFGGFTAAAGHHFYTARNYPERFHDRIAFVCEPTGNLVHAALIEKQGAGFVEKDGWNLFASADEWSSPVEAKVGPDGQVWIADWYNFIVQHNPTPTEERGGFAGENGKGNAYVNPLRDREHGRIWRVVYKKDPAGKQFSLDRNKPDGLLAALQSDNLFWRMTAQRLIVERGKEDIVPQVLDLLEKNKDASSLHAIWILDGLDIVKRDNVKPAVEKALRHSLPSVRRAAIQILHKNGLLERDMLDEEFNNESAPEVQLASLLAMADMAPSSDMGQNLYRLSLRESIIADPYLAQAVYVAASKHRAGFIAAYLQDHPEFGQETERQLPMEDPTLDDSAWSSMDLPQSIEDGGEEIDGEIWFRSTIELTAAEAAKGIQLHLGPIDDSDETWVNGTKVGETLEDWAKERIYQVPARLLTAGKNTIAVKVADERGRGGFVGSPEQFFWQSGSEQKPFAKSWKYKVTKITRSADNNIFKDTSLGEVLVKTYLGDYNPDDLAADGPTGGRKIDLGVIKNEMKYNTTDFTVTAGETIEIVFKNDDFMQHNLVIGRPGSLEAIGAAADRIATEPNGAEKNYVPSIPQILYHTRLVNPNETVSLSFKVPDEAGDYPFVCTFPGHWRIMNGVMKVVKKDAI